MEASQNGHVEVVDTLLQYGARVHLKQKVPKYYNIISISDNYPLKNNQA